MSGASIVTIEHLKFQHGALEFSAIATGEGPLVLCLHGFPDNAHSYDLQLPVLAEAGYRAVSVNLRGYETTSIAPDAGYRMGELATDVVAILDQLEVERAHLIGHDWGASITYTAGALAPQRFYSLTTMAVPHAGRFANEAFTHPRQLRLSWYMFFFQLRGVAEYVVERNDFAFIRKLWRDWSPGWEIPEDELEGVIESFRQPGVKQAALGYYRAALGLRSLPVGKAAKSAAGFSVPVPTLAITGEQDGCIDSGIFQQLMYPEDFPAGLQVEQIPNAGHFPHREQPEVVNALLLKWLQSHSELL